MQSPCTEHALVQYRSIDVRSFASLLRDQENTSVQQLAAVPFCNVGIKVNLNETPRIKLPDENESIKTISIKSVVHHFFIFVKTAKTSNNLLYDMKGLESFITGFSGSPSRDHTLLSGWEGLVW